MISSGCSAQYFTISGADRSPSPFPTIDEIRYLSCRKYVLLYLGKSGMRQRIRQTCIVHSIEVSRYQDFSSLAQHLLESLVQLEDRVTNP